MTMHYSKAIKLMAASSLVALAIIQPSQAFAKTESTTPSGGSNANTSPIVTHVPVAEQHLVPVRAIAEAIGANVKWQGAEQQVLITRGPLQLSVKLGGDEVTRVVDGNTTKVVMSSPAVIVNGAVSIPLTALNEVFQTKLNWNDKDGLSTAAEDVQTAGSHFVQLLQTGQYAKARAMLTAQLQQLMPEALLAQYWAANTALYGGVGELLSLGEEHNAVHHNALLGYKSKAGIPFGLIVRFNSAGKIDDLFMPLAPAGAYQKPDYDKSDAYTEQEVVIGQGDTALPATLTLPAGEGPFPAVVLVHGSGPNDRDESIGSYKTFRDLAVGLAGQKVAVLRYEKRTREHSLKSAMNPSFTVQEETVDDAITAVQSLQKNSRVDASQIYVLGHSQGGMLVPRILNSDVKKNIAGSIVMAGPSRPLEDVLIEQNEQALKRLEESGQPVEAAKQQVELLKQQIALLKDPQYSVTNLPPGFAMQNPVWWMDFRNTYAGEAAKDQTVPLLVLQGENDFQVTPDHLDGWKKALAARQNVAYKLYPKLNHGFVAYDKPSTGEEYALPGNVPAEVINDIASWLKKQKQ